jgi:hypothetical protein
MSAYDRGCVKTRNYGDVQKIGLPGCAVLYSLTSVDGRKTPKIVLAMSFYTASTHSGRSRLIDREVPGLSVPEWKSNGLNCAFFKNNHSNHG